MSKYLKIIGFSLILAISCEDAADDLADAIVAGGGTVYTDSDVMGVYYGTSSYMYANGDCSGDLGTDLMGFHENTIVKFDADTMFSPPVCVDADGNRTYVEDPADCNGTYQDENQAIATWDLVNNTVLLTFFNDGPIANIFTVTETGGEIDFPIEANCNCDENIDDCPQNQTECEALGEAVAEWIPATCGRVIFTKQ